MISLIDWQSSSAADDGGGSEKVVMVVVLFVRGSGVWLVKASP